MDPDYSLHPPSTSPAPLLQYETRPNFIPSTPPNRYEVKAELQRLRNGEIKTCVGDWFVIAGIITSGASGIAVGTLAIFGILSNPVGWGILAGVGALGLTATLIGTYFILSAKSKPIKNLAVSYGVGLSVVAALALAVLIITGTVLVIGAATVGKSESNKDAKVNHYSPQAKERHHHHERDQNSGMFNSLGSFILGALFASTPKEPHRWRHHEHSRIQDQPSSTPIFLTSGAEQQESFLPPVIIDSLIKKNEENGLSILKKLLKLECIKRPREDNWTYYTRIYDQAIKELHNRHYKDACDILWYLNSQQPNPSIKDEIRLIMIAMQNYNDEQSDYFNRNSPIFQIS